MATDDQMTNRMIVGQMMREAWEGSPPDVSEWVRALKGCAQLYELAATHLEADPPNYKEAVRCLGPALQTGVDLRHNVILGYVMDGSAVDDFMEHARQGVEAYRSEQEQA